MIRKSNKTNKQDGKYFKSHQVIDTIYFQAANIGKLGKLIIFYLGAPASPAGGRGIKDLKSDFPALTIP